LNHEIKTCKEPQSNPFFRKEAFVIPSSKALRIGLFVNLFLACVPSTGFALQSEQDAPETRRIVPIRLGHDEHACEKLKVVLGLEGQIIEPPIVGHGFVVPPQLPNSDVWKDKDAGDVLRVDVKVECDGEIVNLPGVSAAWFQDEWSVGNDYPPFAEKFRPVERGTWLSYLTTGEVQQTVTWADPPEQVLNQLRREQPTASGARARDIAYALAVLQNDYTVNRNYLVDLLDLCDSIPPANVEETEDDEESPCSGPLVDFLANLYWRGDDEIAELLLTQHSPFQSMTNSLASFYADLFRRRPCSFANVLARRTIEQQAEICHLAGDEFGMDPELPEVKDAIEAFRSSSQTIAETCLREFKKGT
jgi:hypothetical protein